MKICLWTSIEIHVKGTLRELEGFFGVYQNTSTLGLYVCTCLRAFGALLLTSGVFFLGLPEFHIGSSKDLLVLSGTSYRSYTALFAMQFWGT